MAANIKIGVHSIMKPNELQNKGYANKIGILGIACENEATVNKTSESSRASTIAALLMIKKMIDADTKALTLLSFHKIGGV